MTLWYPSTQSCSCCPEDLEEEKETPTETDLSEKQKHQLRHRELFLSRQYESLPATHIRGKCSVALLNETEAVLSYLDKEGGRDLCSRAGLQQLSSAAQLTHECGCSLQRHHAGETDTHTHTHTK
ncbi:hypothetical protein CRUP_021671 [Coryphaenoides rupestris]|nr:hypothetical protein CRUP_021671 [Coryphaenoides rupestris]